LVGTSHEWVLKRVRVIMSLRESSLSLLDQYDSNSESESEGRNDEETRKTSSLTTTIPMDESVPVTSPGHAFDELFDRPAAAEKGRDGSNRSLAGMKRKINETRTVCDVTKIPIFRPPQLTKPNVSTEDTKAWTARTHTGKG